MAARGGIAGRLLRVWFSAGIVGRWASWAARCSGAGSALSGLSGRCVRLVRVPAAAPLWKPRLLWGNLSGGGTPPILSRYGLRRSKEVRIKRFEGLPGLLFTLANGSLF